MSLVATFGANTQWAGRTIMFEDGAFVLEDHGSITATDVLEYDRLGHLVWAEEGRRQWVQSMVPSPMAAATASPMQSAAVTAARPLAATPVQPVVARPLQAAGMTPAAAPRVIATFGPSTGWQGKTITYDGAVFTLEDWGGISAADVVNYDRQGHLVWADAGTRDWVEGQATAAQALGGAPGAGVGATIASGWAKIAAGAGVASVAVGKAAEATAASFSEGRSTAKTKADDQPAAGFPAQDVVSESMPAAGSMQGAETSSGAEETLTTAPATADSPGVSIADEVAKLADLHARGVLTDEEFAAYKAKLMG